MSIRRSCDRGGARAMDFWPYETLQSSGTLHFEEALVIPGQFVQLGFERRVAH
jgi:hypothetical protein